MGTVPKPRDGVSGMPTGDGEDWRTSAESLCELLWAKKTQSLKPRKHSSEGHELGKATTGTAGRASPLQTWLLLPQEITSVGWEMFSACLSASLTRGRLEPGACRACQGRAELPTRRSGHREQQEGERKWQNLFKTSPDQGAINQAQK